MRIALLVVSLVLPLAAIAAPPICGHGCIPGAPRVVTPSTPSKSTVLGSGVNLPSEGSREPLRMKSGGITAYNLPAMREGRTWGTFNLSEGTFASVVSPWSNEIQISKVRGQITPSTAGCYSKRSNLTLHAVSWTTSASPSIKCKVDGPGPWYINVRYTYAGCRAVTCGWNRSWSSSK